MDKYISTYGLLEWFMFLTLYLQLTYVNVLHWIVRLIYCGFLVNEGIYLILVIQTFYIHLLLVYYTRKDVYPTSYIVYSTIFPFIILKSYFTMLNAFLPYWYYDLFIFMYTLLYAYIISLLTTFGCSLYFYKLTLRRRVQFHRIVTIVGSC